MWEHFFPSILRASQGALGGKCLLGSMKFRPLSAPLSRQPGVMWAFPGVEAGIEPMCWWSQAPCKTLREWKPTTIPWVWGSYLENEERAGSFQVICYRLSQWSPLRYTAGVTDELQSSGHHWSIHRHGPWMPVHVLNHSSPTYLVVTHPRCI